MAGKKVGKKLLSKMGNTKTRTIVMFMAVIFIIIIGIAISRITSGTDPLAQRASTTTAVPQNIKAVPGNKTPEKYRELQLIDNERRAEEARRTSGSAIPTIMHTDIIKGTGGGFGLTGNEIIHGIGPYGPYGLNPDGTPFGIGPDGKPYNAKGWHVMGFGPHGPYGIGPDGKPFGVGPDGKPFGIGPDGKPIKFVVDGDQVYAIDADGSRIPIPLTANTEDYAIHGYGPYGPYGVDANGKPFGIGPDGKPYDPTGPFAPEWYEPPVKSEAERLTEVAKDDREAIERMRREREAEVQKNRTVIDQRRRQQVSQQQVAERSGLMDAQAKALFQSWANYPLQFYTAKSPNAPGQSPLAANAGLGGAAGQPGRTVSNEVIKAGSLLFAVIDTSVNSDVPGPILATVVHGRYKGARLIGNFTPPDQNSEGLKLQFQQMTMDDIAFSVPINAVAVDPDTARTMLASDVDHHYLLRYGTLFASAFMEGYADAISQQGATSTDRADGSTTSTTPVLSGKEEIFTALGSVGSKWSKQVQPLFQTLPTITINSGTGVGVLFVGDLDLEAMREQNGVSPQMIADREAQDRAAQTGAANGNIGG